MCRAQAYLYFAQSLRSFDDLKRRYDGKRDELMRHRTNLMVCVQFIYSRWIEVGATRISFQSFPEQNVRDLGYYFPPCRLSALQG
jgi:hypothetical protein